MHFQLFLVKASAISKTCKYYAECNTPIHCVMKKIEFSVSVSERMCCLF